MLQEGLSYSYYSQYCTIASTVLADGPTRLAKHHSTAAFIPTYNTFKIYDCMQHHNYRSDSCNSARNSGSARHWHCCYCCCQLPLLSQISSNRFCALHDLATTGNRSQASTTCQKQRNAFLAATAAGGNDQEHENIDSFSLSYQSTMCR